jgi:hypothetical protein
VKQNVAHLSAKIQVELWSELKRESYSIPTHQHATEGESAALAIT